MVYKVIYNNGEASCSLFDFATFSGFIKYVTTKDKYPVAVLKIRRKFKQVEIIFPNEAESEVPNEVLPQ